jgi:hypothetical protein
MCISSHKCFHMGNNINVNVGSQEVVTVSQQELRTVVATSMVYPKAKSMEEKEIKMCDTKIPYTCDSEKCQFAVAITAIQKNSVLNQKGVKETAEAVVTTIDQNQNLFTAGEVGGYVIQSLGLPFLFLENKSVKRTPDTPVGFIDLTEVRRGLIYKEIQKNNTINDWWKIATASVLSSGFVAIMFKLAKK